MEGEGTYIAAISLLCFRILQFPTSKPSYFLQSPICYHAIKCFATACYIHGKVLFHIFDIQSKCIRQKSQLIIVSFQLVVSRFLVFLLDTPLLPFLTFSKTLRSPHELVVLINKILPMFVFFGERTLN